MGPSLQISDTMFTDEGEYLYRVITDSGDKDVELSIIVIGEFFRLMTKNTYKHTALLTRVLVLIIVLFFPNKMKM